MRQLGFWRAEEEHRFCGAERHVSTKVNVSLAAAHKRSGVCVRESPSSEPDQTAI